MAATAKKKERIVHAYAKGAPQGEFAVTVMAPIITDSRTQEGVQALLDYVAAIQAHSNMEIAEKETERLRPYFSALSVYLTRVLEEVDPENKETLKGLVAPGQLSGIFNAMARFTRVTLLSDVVIMPRSIYYSGPAENLFGSGTFIPSFKYGHHPFSFGFLKIFEGGDINTAHSSTTIPTFMLDTGLMDTIAPHQPEEAYRLFQKIVTDMNHDMLHHLHSIAVDEAIAHKFNGNDHDSPVWKWGESLVGSPYRIEEWSQLSHGKVFMASGNEALVEEVGADIKRYFDELERIGKALPPGKAHEVVDYFGTVIAQTLSRTFPFNHPLMIQCLDRMKKADPLSGESLLKATIEQYALMNGPPSANSAADVRLFARRGPEIANIIEGYRQQGFDILPDDDKDISYEGIKLLQLVKLEPNEMRSHVPTPVGAVEQAVRAGSDEAFLKLLGAVAKTTKYRPA